MPFWDWPIGQKVEKYLNLNLPQWDVGEHLALQLDSWDGVRLGEVGERIQTFQGVT